MAILSPGCFGPIKPGVRRQKRPHQRDRFLVPFHELRAVAAVPPTMTGIVVIRDLVCFEVHQRVGDAGPVVSIKSPNQTLHFILRSLSLTSEK
jgi:hypothetical protein